jgi:8-oxo-dGTP diphosphatase
MRANYPLIGVGAVIWRDDALVLIRRSKPPKTNEWSIPGGRQEVGETVAAAVLREVVEETGLDVELLGLIDVVDAIFPGEAGGMHYTIVDFSARWVTGEARAGSDATALVWVPFRQLPQFELWSETRRIIEMSARMHGPLAGAR